MIACPGHILKGTKGIDMKLIDGWQRGDG